MIVGLVLCGGRSRRFGAEKAVAPFGDGVLMDVPLRALGSVCVALAVSARAGSGAESHASKLGVDSLSDAPGDVEGPLAGIRRGLQWASARGAHRLALAPCDAVSIEGCHYETLVDALTDDEAAIVAISSTGLEPLVSIWPVGAGLRAVGEAVTDGLHPPIRHVLDRLGASQMRLRDYDGANVNFPQDLLQRPGPGV